MEGDTTVEVAAGSDRAILLEKTATTVGVGACCVLAFVAGLVLFPCTPATIPLDDDG